MKSEPEAGASRLNNPVKPPPKRVEDATKTELFDALKALFAGEEPNLIFEDPPRKGGMFRAECAMMLHDLNPLVYREPIPDGRTGGVSGLVESEQPGPVSDLDRTGEGWARDGAGSGAGADA